MTSACSAGLTPADFWSATPWEVRCAIDARGKVLESAQTLLAWHLAGVLNMVSKHRITPASLLGRRESEDIRAANRAESPEAFRAAMTRAWIAAED